MMAGMKMHFISSSTEAAVTAAERLSERYGHVPLREAEVIVALGGDGLMLQALHRFVSTGTPIYGTFLEGENIYGTTLTEEGVVVMGNEGRGISQAAARAVTHKLFIPPYPADRRGSESLNVAMATGIVCSEFRRRAGMGSGK